MISKTFFKKGGIYDIHAGKDFSFFRFFCTSCNSFFESFQNIQ